MGKGTRIVPLDDQSSKDDNTVSSESNTNSSSTSSTSSTAPLSSSTSSTSSSTSSFIPVPLSTNKKNNRSFFGKIIHGLERIIVSCIRALPSEFRYILTLIAFWPTVWFNRWYCYWFPHRRQLYNRIHEYIILSSLPLYKEDVQTLYKDYGVRAVVNMCREWNTHDGPNGIYDKLNIEQLYLPTIDFDPPTYDQLVKGVEFVKQQITAKRTVLIHCKAGRGRSVALCLAYFVMHEGMTPEAADAHIRAIRPHISSKWKLDVIQAFVGLRNRVSSSLHLHNHHHNSNNTITGDNSTMNDQTNSNRMLTKRRSSTGMKHVAANTINDMNNNSLSHMGKQDSSLSLTSSTDDTSTSSDDTKPILVVRLPDQ